MAAGQAIAFVAFAGVLVVLTLLVLVGVGIVRLESPLGVLRDGIPDGKRAPSWRLADAAGVTRQCPSGRWQLLLFADHSLREFPDLVAGLKRLTAEEPELETLVLSKGHMELTERLLAGPLGLDLPILHVDDAFYRRFNVRVMPFVFFVDPAGVVRAPAIVNHEDSLQRMWTLAQARASRPASEAVAAT
jgi:hypothetical protein